MTEPVAWATGRLRFFRRPFHEYRLTDRVVLSQTPLFITTLLTAFLMWAFFPGTMDNPLFVAFLVSQLAIMALCYLVPWDRLPYTSFLVIPLLDFVSIAVGREGGQESLTGISLLSVFPVIWLCASGYYPRTSLWLSFLAPLAIIWVPLFIHGDVSGPSLAKSLLLPVMMLGIGVSVSVLTLSMMRQQRTLEEKDEQLQASLRGTKQQEALLNSVLETVNIGVLAVDADGHDILMNRKQRANHELARPARHRGSERVAAAGLRRGPHHTCSRGGATGAQGCPGRDLHGLPRLAGSGEGAAGHHHQCPCHERR